MKNKPVSYKQYDGKWRNVSYAAKGEKNDIRSAGCGITCAAMVIASLKDKKVTPVDTAKWSLAHGYKIKRQGTSYAYFKPQFEKYGIKCKQLNGANVYHNLKADVHKEARKALEDGQWLISVMSTGRWTKHGHFILAYACKDGYVYINDPASIMPNRLKAKISDWQNEVKYYWKIEVPEDKKVKF